MTRGDSYPAFDLPSILTGSFDMMNIEKTLSKPIQHDPDAKTLNISESTKPISLCCTKCKSENSEVLFEAASGFMKICRCKNCGRIFSDDAKCFDEEELISNIREHYTIEQLGNLFKKILEKY